MLPGDARRLRFVLAMTPGVAVAAAGGLPAQPALPGPGGVRAPEEGGIPVPPGIDGGDPLIARAVEEAIERVRTASGDARAWDVLGKVYFAHGHPVEALECFARAGSLGGPAPERLYLRALAWVELGRVEEALALAARAREMEAGYAPLWWRPGLWLLEKGRAEEAGGLFRRALGVDPRSEEARIGLARLSLQRREAERAESIVREHLLGGRNDAYARQLLATALRMLGRAGEAAEEMARSRGAGPEFNDPWLEAVTALRTGYHAESERIDALLRAGRYAQAERLARRLLEYHPRDAMVLNNLGVARFGQSDREGAATIWRRVLELDEGNALAHQNLAVYEANRAMTRGEPLADAIAHIERALETNPASSRSWEVRGGLLLATGRLDEAERSFARALEVDPENLAAIGQLGQVALRRGEWVEAAELFERITRVAPDDPRGHVELARALIEGERYRDAADALARAESLLGRGDARVVSLRSMLERRRDSGGGGG